MSKEDEREARFRAWSKPLGESEEDRCDRAKRMIMEVLRDAPELRNLDVEVFAQGSFRNNTNIVGESDVDICVRTTTYNFADLSRVLPATKYELGMTDTDYTYSAFKRAVAAPLKRRFGEACAPGDKAIAIRANTSRVDADVVACFEGRQYYRTASGIYYHSGTAFVPDSRPSPTYNWPEQHHERGVEKNIATGYRFKYMARVLKSIRLELDAPHRDTPSFLVECLVYNVPNDRFGSVNYVDDMVKIISWLLKALKERPTELVEVSGIKPLFGAGQSWTPETALAFVTTAISQVI